MDLKIRANAAAFPRTDDTFSKSLIQQSQQSLFAAAANMPEKSDLRHAALAHLGIGPIVGAARTVNSHHISPGLLAESQEQPKQNFW